MNKLFFALFASFLLFANSVQAADLKGTIANYQVIGKAFTDSYGSANATKLFLRLSTSPTSEYYWVDLKDPNEIGKEMLAFVMNSYNSNLIVHVVYFDTVSPSGSTYHQIKYMYVDKTDNP